MSEGVIIREGLAAMDFATVREWLARSYWTPGVERAIVERAAQNSALVVGAFAGDGAQVGFMRVVSDKTRFAYLCDVIVDEAWRGRGVARTMVQQVLDHSELATVTTWTLATRDAHGVYEPIGFKPMAHTESRPETWMVLRRGRAWAEPRVRASRENESSPDNVCRSREITIASPEAGPYSFHTDGQSEGNTQANQTRRA